MTITLLPHQEKALEAAIEAGVIPSVEVWIETAIAGLTPAGESDGEPQAPSNLMELFAPIRGLFANGELDFTRDRSPDRPVNLG